VICGGLLPRVAVYCGVQTRPRTTKKVQRETQKQTKRMDGAGYPQGYDDGTVDAFTAFYAGNIPPGACSSLSEAGAGRDRWLGSMQKETTLRLARLFTPPRVRGWMYFFDVRLTDDPRPL